MGPDTPARAAEVNDNFQALNGEIQSNAEAIADLALTVSPPGAVPQLHRTVDCTGGDSDADYTSVSDALAGAPAGLLQLDISGMCNENVAISVRDGVTLSGDPFDGNADGIVAVNPNLPALVIDSSHLAIVLDLSVRGGTAAIRILGTSSVVLSSVGARAETGHAIEVSSSELSLAFDNSLTGGGATGSAALSAESSTIVIDNIENSFNAGVPGAVAVDITHNSSFVVRDNYAPRSTEEFGFETELISRPPVQHSTAPSK